MIVPMKKAAIIVQSKDAKSATEKLRSIGVLHVEHQRAPKGMDISSLAEDIATLDKVMGILSAPGMEGTSGLKPAKMLPDWRFIAKHVLDSSARIDQLEEYARNLASGIAEWGPWGDFDPAELDALKTGGVHVKLYQVPANELKDLPQGVIVRKIGTGKGMVRCALISRGGIEVPFKETQPPNMSLGEMKARLAENNEIVKSLKETLHKYTFYVERFTRIRDAFRKELEFHEALRGMGEAKELSYLVGYAPHDRVGALTDAAKREKWGISVKDPSEDDIVPTLIRNPRWVSIISPVFRLIEIVPGYHELDMSFWFLMFFSVFFGMLIGDAGYGMIFFALTIFFQSKFGARMKDKSIFYLFYILSSCAIIWGVLTGTFFGQEWLQGHFKPLIPALRDDRNVQALCFFIGAAHLSIAHLWRGLVKLPSVAALADVGWTMILWGGFFLAKLLILGDAFPPQAVWLFIAGPILVVIFAKPSRNIVKMLGAGVGALLLNIVNSFTDIVSYIRLFAVGLATVAVADSFNKMAMDIGFGNIFTGIATALVLLIGHALNIVLGPMSVLVHGVRLNVLEFCSHVNITWSGFAYRPLKEK